MEGLISKKLDTKKDMKKTTSLCIGPVSKNCIDAVLEITDEFNVPITLVLSRNQIETKELGHGYVNNWTTEEFSKYISNKNSNRNIILARDHGGPWKNDSEKNQRINFEDAWNNAKKSFIADIDSGFKIFHIDPTTDLFSELSINEKINRACELCKFCNDAANLRNQKIEFEISLWDDGATEDNYVHMDSAISKISNYFKENSIKTPLSFAIPTGNKVINLGNTGLMKTITTDSEIFLKLSKSIQTCKKFNVKTKVHATDYLSDESLQWFPKLGIDAANVAPEFGTIESKTLLDILSVNKLYELREEFLKMSYSSKKWTKWISDDHILNKNELSILAGHYIFPSDEFNNLKNKIQNNLEENIDKILIKSIKNNILRYLKSFNILC